MLMNFGITDESPSMNTVTAFKGGPGLAGDCAFNGRQAQKHMEHNTDATSAAFMTRHYEPQGCKKTVVIGSYIQRRVWSLSSSVSPCLRLPTPCPPTESCPAPPDHRPLTTEHQF